MDGEWKEIDGFPGYRISSFGNLYSMKLKRNLIPPINWDGYYRVNLWNKMKAAKKVVHRLVAEAFIPNPESLPVVNHINGNKLDNRVENLEWDTVAGNNKHSREVLGNICPKGVHSKPIILQKENEEVQFKTTRAALAFLRCSGKRWNDMKAGGTPINGYKIKK